MTQAYPKMPLLDEERWYETDACGTRNVGGMPALFLDRDGVIVVEKHYLCDPDQVELYPGVRSRLANILAARMPIILVTNQSGIGQGMFDWQQYERVHGRMMELLNLDRPFTAVYANAHHPKNTSAAWRKPNPGMFFQAAADLNIVLEKSYMVGDKLIDLQAASAARLRRLVHVRTGHGDRERKSVRDRFPEARCLDSLADLDIPSEEVR